MSEPIAPARCHQCGREGVMYFHGFCADCFFDDEPDDDSEPNSPDFECHGFNDGTGFYCPLWGSEECDWECPNGGLLR